jgi:hypothetical protein
MPSFLKFNYLFILLVRCVLVLVVAKARGGVGSGAWRCAGIVGLILLYFLIWHKEATLIVGEFWFVYFLNYVDFLGVSGNFPF